MRPFRAHSAAALAIVCCFTFPADAGDSTSQPDHVIRCQIPPEFEPRPGEPWPEIIVCQIEDGGSPISTGVSEPSSANDQKSENRIANEEPTQFPRASLTIAGWMSLRPLSPLP